MPSGSYADAGGGTSDHAALSNLDYQSAGHTGFAGTATANIFSRKQTFYPSLSDVALDDPELVNYDFATAVAPSAPPDHKRQR